MHIIARTAVVACLLMAGHPASSEEALRFDTVHHYRVEVPVGWKRMPDTEVKLDAAQLRSFGLHVPTEVAAFRPESPDTELEHPRLVIAWTEGNPMYLWMQRESEWLAATERPLLDSYGEVMGSLELGEYRFDATRNCMMLRAAVRGPELVEVEVLFGLLLGARGFVFICLYGQKGKVDELREEFAAVLDSVSFETGYEFVPPDYENIPLSRRVDARKLVETLRYVDWALADLSEVLEGDASLTPAGRKRFLAEVTMRKSEFVKAVAEVYAAHFTESELQALTTFYASPVGKKWAALEGRVLQELEMASARWSNEVRRVLEASLKR